MPNKPKLLIATAQRGHAVLKGMFSAEADAVFVFTLDEAIHELDKGGVDCLLASLHFDESRMFDLVRHARIHAPQVPCVCTRLLDTMLRGSLLDGMLIAVESLGARFIDRYELQRAYGNEAGDAEFKKRVLEISRSKAGD